MGMFSFIICLVCVVFLAVKVKKAVRKAFPMPDAPEEINEADDYDSFAEEEKPVRKSEEYFSYENIPGDSCFTEQSTSKKTRTVKTTPTTETDSNATSVDFDLRQAVIYNTILNNDYIGERI